jgi:hypothetical protein
LIGLFRDHGTPTDNGMEASFPTVESLRDIESRQDEVLRKLDELEAQIAAALAAFGDQRMLKAAEVNRTPDAASTNPPVPLARAA